MEENKPNEINENWTLVSYLIGAMEKTASKDDGGSARVEFEKELILRNVYPINPVKLEQQKTGKTTTEMKEKMKGWVEGGCWDLFNECAIDIWKGKNLAGDEGLVHIPGDIDYVIMSDFLTFIFNRGDICCGSFAEAGIAMEHGIPIYLITNMPKRELPKSLLQMIGVSDGEVFENIHQFLEFIDKKYHLKRKEEK